MRQTILLLSPFFFLLIFAVGCNNVSSNDSITTSREECDGVPNCTSVEASELTSIDENGIHVLHFICPDEAPNIHNMDVDQNDNIIVSVIEWSENAVTVSFRKQVPEMAGLYQPFLGCSTELFNGGERFRGRGSIPDGLPDDPSEVPTEANFKTPTACHKQLSVDCINVLSKRHRIGHLKTHHEEMRCPDTHPWYAAYESSTSSPVVVVIEVVGNQLRFQDKGDSFYITNLSLIHDHHWQIAIACSAGCIYSPKGCPCDDDDRIYGCRNDPGCKTTETKKIECARGDCLIVWEETCADGDEWSCDSTVNGWTCCENCE